MLYLRGMSTGEKTEAAFDEEWTCSRGPVERHVVQVQVESEV